MEDKKYCQKCGRFISDINTADYYRHIRVKYCKSCASDVNRENAAVRSAEIRKQTRENNKLARQLNKELLKENEMLKRQLEEVRERMEKLSK